MTTKETKAGERTVKAFVVLREDGTIKQNMFHDNLAVFLSEKDARAATFGKPIRCTITYSLT